MIRSWKSHEILSRQFRGNPDKGPSPCFRMTSDGSLIFHIFRSTYEKAVDERDDEVNDVRRSQQKDRELRQRADERVQELNKALQNTQKAYNNEIESLKQKLQDQKHKIHQLNTQVIFIKTSIPSYRICYYYG